MCAISFGRRAENSVKICSATKSSCFLARLSPTFQLVFSSITLVKSLRILHLEDDADDVELAHETLSDAGLDAQYLRVETRHEFESALGDKTIDVILADYVLPAFDGETALQLAQRLCPNVPFLFLSGTLGEERAIETLKSGATDYVFKHRMERLPAAIERALRESKARSDHEKAQNALNFLAEAGAALAASLDYETTLNTLAQFAVPFLADCCIVDIFGDNDLPQAVAVAHVLPEIGEIIRTTRKKYEFEETYSQEMLRALKRGEPILTPTIPDEWFRQYESDPEHLAFVQQLNVHSAMSVPLQARGRTLGFVSFSTVHAVGGSDRVYDEADLTLAKSLTNRAALAIDNARLYRETQNALRARDEFLATLSHELRTPLNAMLGWTQLLRAGELDEAMTAVALEVIERNTKAQAQLIEDLLEVSRIITGKLRLDVQPVEIARVITDALESVRLTADAKEIALEFVNRDDCVVAGDAHRLQQVVWNLLSNALKFTPKGGQVKVVLENVDSYTCICVQDSGQGIDSSFLPHVFERFRQADSSSTRSVDGLGLGLGIVRHLVELHGGSVRAESDGENRGATFTVSLPLLAVCLGERKTETPSIAPRRVSPKFDLQLSRLADVRVLVVDDQPDARRLVAKVLESCGAQVETANSAREAWQKLQEQHFDVLISDIGMPDEDGSR